MDTPAHRIVLLNREMNCIIARTGWVENIGCTKFEVFENSCIIGLTHRLEDWAEAILTVSRSGTIVGMVPCGDDVMISWNGTTPDEFILTKLSN